VPKGCFVGLADGLRCEKGVKERAQHAAILAVPRLLKTCIMALTFIYVKKWCGGRFKHLSLTPLVLSAYALKACSKKIPAKVHLLFFVLFFTVFLLLVGIFCFLFQLHRYLRSFKK